MNQPAATFDADMRQSARTAPGAAVVVRPFCGMLDPVLVGEPAPFSFPGSMTQHAAQAVWTWVVRDLASDLISSAGVANGNFRASDLEPLVPELLLRMKEAVEASGDSAEADRRLRAQVGRDRAPDEIGQAMSALRARLLLGKAQGFGKAVNTISEDGALGVALQAMPLQDAKLAALLFHAAVGQVINPTRLIGTAVKLSGGASETALMRQGFGPLIDAHLAHAQDQIRHLEMRGPFADIDLACRSLDRFHKLVRALSGYIEFSRGSRSAQALSTITTMLSDRTEPHLREVVTDINQALRKPQGTDRIDRDRLLAAINGVYLLVAVRESRDSLALNAVFDQAWSQSGQALELHIQRNLELLRQNPGDPIVLERIDASIKMAEIRFNPDYADTLRRAKATAQRY